MMPALRPMRLGEILDRTFEIYRRKFLLFVGIAALPALATFALHAADDNWLHSGQLVRTHNRGGAAFWGFVVGLGYYHISSFLGLLLMPAFVRACSDTIFGDPTSIRDSLRFAAVRWRSYAWLALLKELAELIVPELLALGSMFGIGFAADKMGLLDGSMSSPLVFIILSPAMAAALLFLWIAARLSFAFPTAAIEQLNGIKALRRSWSLSKGSRLRIVYTWLILTALALILSLSLQLLNRWLFYALYAATHSSFFGRHLYYEVAYFINALVATGIGPVFPIALVLFYYDQRVRREGFDLEKMMEAAGLNAVVPVPAGGEQTAPVTVETAPEGL
jgi:hypothetical protein